MSVSTQEERPLLASTRDKATEDGLDERVSAAVAEFRANRAVIEQAKGMLMFIYGLDADRAFAVLKEHSQRHNLKLRVVAQQILDDLVELSRSPSPLRHLQYDPLVMSAQRRVAKAWGPDSRSSNGE
ncbi:MAG: ANTAR domain-containing protein [Mycobacterium sp.]